MDAQHNDRARRELGFDLAQAAGHGCRLAEAASAVARPASDRAPAAQSGPRALHIRIKMTFASGAY